MTRLVDFSSGSVAFFPPGVVDALRAGGMAIYPTDTLYGLGADPASAEGMGRLLRAKSREGGKPVPLLLDGPERVERFALDVPDGALRLMDRFWPGALTIVLPAAPDVPPAITGGSAAVGLRVPDHPIARALAKALGGAITGTSANRAGNPGLWRTADEVIREFTGEVEWILWDGPPVAAQAGDSGARVSSSTVVRFDGDDPVLLREGAIPFRTVTDFLKRG